MCSVISKSSAFDLPAEQPRGQVQMRGAADRQKFGEALDHRQDDHLQNGHKGSG